MNKSSELFSISCQKFLLDTKFWNFFIILNLFQPQKTPTLWTRELKVWIWGQVFQSTKKKFDHSWPPVTKSQRKNGT